LAFTGFYPAVLFAAYFGGLRVGIFAAILGGLIGWWAFLPPHYWFFPLSLTDELELLAYGLACAIIIWGADRYRRRSDDHRALADKYRALAERLQDEEDFRKLAVEELSHRLKNKVATILSIINFPLREYPKIRNEISDRLVALAATDDLIMKAHGEGVHIHDLLSAELCPYEASRISTAGRNIFLAPKLALTMALLIHELATNAAKYGALSTSTGTVSINWSVSSETLEMYWRESGGPRIGQPTHRGFGLQLISRALDQFNGAAEMTFQPTGLICKIKAELSEIIPRDISKLATPLSEAAE
jgi:two-component sensor histidine kinase